MSRHRGLLAPVIVALDLESGEAARALVARLGSETRHYKVGLQLLTLAGPELVRELVTGGKEVFLDLKLHEIPGSVAGAVRAAGQLGVSLVTVHASGGSEVLRAAVAAAEPFPELRILALTVITSLTDEDLPEIGLAPSVTEQVKRLAQLAMSCRCDGVVASPREASILRELLPPECLIVTPGIRLSGSPSRGQTRVSTPADAATSGATHIVVGREITAAVDPRAAFALANEAFRQHRPAGRE